MSKRSSFGYMVRKRLSDITNSQSQSQVLFQDENILETGPSAEEYVNRLTKEIDLARNKVKALQHEIVCKNALLKAKTSELEAMKQREDAVSRNTVAAENVKRNVNEEEGKPSETNRRRIVRSKSMGASTAQRSEVDKAKAEIKGRRQRRRSSRFGSRDHGDGHNLFEIENLQLTMPNGTHQDKEQEQEQDRVLERRDAITRQENSRGQRSSMGWPLRRSVEKIHSYKEVPLNAKMRRPL
ncbi:PREDICTED: shugoshin-1 isoform X2 [Tarenaya hassleriana]|uniref:shugoshin-1 isoform X2 n=1 Tax=Tarenaya hassleriana TaxID=28532 RepID=UPI00053C68E8|nr:PREDICTED: shugoshin-1 isoform X2 [Tarenaya hassleriana]